MIFHNRLSCSTHIYFFQFEEKCFQVFLFPLGTLIYLIGTIFFLITKMELTHDNMVRGIFPFLTNTTTGLFKQFLYALRSFPWKFQFLYVMHSSVRIQNINPTLKVF